jgi:hypothetical protein
MYSSFNYCKNILSDIYYGYIEIKCANKLCGRVHKISRNIFYSNSSNTYCCNMGCSLEAYKYLSEPIENETYNEY